MTGRIPAVLNPNGHHAGGKAMDYKQARCINLTERLPIEWKNRGPVRSTLVLDRPRAKRTMESAWVA